MSSHVSGGSTEAAADAAPGLILRGDIPRDGGGDDEADAGLMPGDDAGCGDDADADADVGRRSRRL